ncbi:MAG: TetR/AcrR family transcriptional regulator [Microthrixaceae bacterium]
MVRRRPEERREEILRAAGEVVLREGFGRTSARELAAAVGVSPGLLHHYFPSMEEVLVRAVQLFTDEDLAQLADEVGEEEDAPALVRLDRVLRWCVPTPDDPACRFWVESWSESLRNPGVAEATRHLNEVWHRGLTDLLTDAAADGDGSCPDPSGSAWRLLALLDGLTVQVLAYGSLGPAELLAQARAAAEIELGLAPGTLAGLEPHGDAGSEGHRRVRTDRGGVRP